MSVNAFYCHIFLIWQHKIGERTLPYPHPSNIHHLSDFLNTEKHEDGLIEALGGLLPEAQGEDYEEQDFANKMKKKLKRQRGQ